MVPAETRQGWILGGAARPWVRGGASAGHSTAQRSVGGAPAAAGAGSRQTSAMGPAAQPASGPGPAVVSPHRCRRKPRRGWTSPWPAGAGRWRGGAAQAKHEWWGSVAAAAADTVAGNGMLELRLLQGASNSGSEREVARVGWSHANWHRKAAGGGLLADQASTEHSPGAPAYAPCRQGQHRSPRGRAMTRLPFVAGLQAFKAAGTC